MSGCLRHAFASAALVLGLSTAARAEQGDRAAAEALFQEGRELMDAGEHQKACAKFEASHQLDESALGTSLHLADCYERIGKTASAWALFEEVASLAQVSGQSQRVEIARVRAAALAPKLSRIDLVVPEDSRVAGLVITVAGSSVPIASWGSAIPSDPGPRAISASAPGFVTWTSTVEVSPGQSQAVTVPRLLEAEREVPPPPPPVVSAAPPPPRPAPPVREAPTLGTVRIAGIVLGSVGLVGLAVGAGLGVRAMDVNEDSLDRCRPDDPSLCSAEGVELRSDAQSYALGSTISFALGGALAATGLLMVVVPHEDGEQVVVSGVGPVFFEDGGVLVARGSW